MNIDEKSSVMIVGEPYNIIVVFKFVRAYSAVCITLTLVIFLLLYTET